MRWSLLVFFSAATSVVASKWVDSISLTSAAAPLRNLMKFLGATSKRSIPTVAPQKEKLPDHSSADEFELQWGYGSDEKLWKYVGSEEWLHQFPRGSRKYFNSLATYPNARPTRMHGDLGYFPNNGTAMFPYSEEEPPALASNATLSKLALEKGGGFYLELSDYLPLDRDPPDNRMRVCTASPFNYSELADASVVITFYNEPMSTLLRSVHSVLNRTPPPLLREIILVDDHSNTTDALPGGFLYKYANLLPKVKILRLPERRGLVMARLAGAQIARAPVLVVLDSHIEVNDGWLEPQLQRLRESPESVVFPQIGAIKSETFEHLKYEGIGCVISFKWIMQERSMSMIYPDSAAAIPSPAMAGGLFAVNLDWFFYSGGYDEEFSMWGAENVEMGFRHWLCGGRVECTPCALTYHIYRHGGVGYKSPSASIVKNRLRTARAWTGELFTLTDKFINRPDFDMGSFDDMLKMQQKLHCREFDYFFKKVDKLQAIRSLDDIDFSGELKNLKHPSRCIDSLSHHNVGETWGFFHCHGMGGTQAFLRDKTTQQLHPASDENKCLNPKTLKIESCPTDVSKVAAGFRREGKRLVWFENDQPDRCLALTLKVDQSLDLGLVPCSQDDGDLEQMWTIHPFVKPPFEPVKFSEAYLDRQRKANEIELTKLETEL